MAQSQASTFEEGAGSAAAHHHNLLGCSAGTGEPGSEDSHHGRRSVQRRTAAGSVLEDRSTEAGSAETPWELGRTSSVEGPNSEASSACVSCEKRSAFRSSERLASQPLRRPSQPLRWSSQLQWFWGRSEQRSRPWSDLSALHSHSVAWCQRQPRSSHRLASSRQRLLWLALWLGRCGSTRSRCRCFLGVGPSTRAACKSG